MVQHSADMRINGSAVVAIRQGRGLSQSALSEEADIGRSHLANVEAGRRTLSPAATKRLAAALRVPLAAILADPAEVGS